MCSSFFNDTFNKFFFVTAKMTKNPIMKWILGQMNKTASSEMEGHFISGIIWLFYVRFLERRKNKDGFILTNNNH